MSRKRAEFVIIPDGFIQFGGYDFFYLILCSVIQAFQKILMTRHDSRKKWGSDVTDCTTILIIYYTEHVGSAAQSVLYLGRKGGVVRSKLIDFRTHISYRRLCT